MDQTREKQIYLKANVMDTGYNTDQFVQYLESKKGNR